MASHSFGTLFRVTTWGESHGRAVGALIDGCPSGLEISEEEVFLALEKRAPGKTPHTSKRKERDRAQILSGVFEGKTTGAPICILIPNEDAKRGDYEKTKHLLRAGHANFTYLAKYGHFDFRGGGRASGRETACRVAAGAVANKLLTHYGIKVKAHLAQVGHIDASDGIKVKALLEQLEKEGDSVGGTVLFEVESLPVGLGDPLYEKLEANLAKALMSIQGCKGFEMGEGFASVRMRGSEHNDLFIVQEGKVKTKSNHSGGVLGGISTGMPLWGRVAFKPASSIRIPQETLDLNLKRATLAFPKEARHDTCIAIRAVPVVEAMVALVLADAILMGRAARL